MSFFSYLPAVHLWPNSQSTYKNSFTIPIYLTCYVNLGHNDSNDFFHQAQYRLVGSAVKHQKAGPWSPTKRERRRWRTDDASVAPDRNTTLVSGLIPGNTYKFRIAAVFASDDQRVSASSTRFMLQQLSPLQPPSFPPNITGAKWVAGVGSRNLELQWTYGDDSQTDGFIVATSVLHSTLPPAKRRFIGSSRRTVTILNVLHEADVSAEGGLLIWLLAYNMAGTSPPSPPRTIHHYQGYFTTKNVEETSIDDNVYNIVSRTCLRLIFVCAITTFIAVKIILS